MSSLGERLRTTREARGYKQVEAADIVEVSKIQLSRYESDKAKPDYETISKLAKLYEVSTDYLIDGVASQRGNEVELSDLLADIQSQVRVKGVELSPEEKKRLNDIIANVFWEKLDTKKE